MSLCMAGPARPTVGARRRRARGRRATAALVATLAVAGAAPAAARLGVLREHEPMPGQVALRVAGPWDGAWKYVVHYATTGETRWAPTKCWAWPADDRSALTTGHGTSATYSNLQYGGIYSHPDDYYTSPYLHQCELTGLAPNTRYFYRIAHERFGPTFDFITPPPPASKFPFTFAVMADVGQTKYSRATFASAKNLFDRLPYSTLVFPGDLSYADGDQNSWDTFADLATPLLAHVELIATPGNHEVERQEAFVAYQARYAPGELWHVEKRGPVTFISLSSYSAYLPGSSQYRWLQATLNEVDRRVTPWLIVQFHAPIINSNSAHQGEAEAMRVAMEPLLFKHRVDLIFNGHVHSYERIHPIFNYTRNECGPTTVIIGDGGNRERAATNWIYPQPEWSAFREASFGFGFLTITSPTQANWTWVRNPFPDYDFPDEFVPHTDPALDSIVIDRSACGSRLHAGLVSA